KNWMQEPYPFNTTKNAFRFLFVTLVMCLIGAGMGAYSLYVNGIVPEEQLLRASLSWWIGNVVGILLFTPFILALAQKHNFRLSLEKGIEISIFMICSIGLYFILQIDYLIPTFERALPFLVLPFLLWIAFRFDLFVAVLFVVVISLWSVYLTIQNEGSFALNHPEN